MVDERIIEDVKEKIRRKFHPEKIILFGSLAKGKPHEYSDLDLFIVMRSDLRRDNRSLAISKLFSDRLFPMDILVYTPEELEDSMRRGNPFIKEILTEGKVIYET